MDPFALPLCRMASAGNSEGKALTPTEAVGCGTYLQLMRVCHRTPWTGLSQDTVDLVQRSSHHVLWGLFA